MSRLTVSQQASDVAEVFSPLRFNNNLGETFREAVLLKSDASC